MMGLVFEIGCEDLPARFVEPALVQLEAVFTEECEDRRIDVAEVETAGTPRRLALLVGSLAETQRDLETTELGPPGEVGLDDAGVNSPASGSFASSHGATEDDLFVDDDSGRVGVEVHQEGEPVRELLPEILDRSVRGLDFPKSMRWAGYDEEFGRPVRWIVAVAGGEVIPFEFAGVESGARTRGHRFAAPDPIEVRTVDAYRSELEEVEGSEEGDEGGDA